MTTEHDEGFAAGIEAAATWYRDNHQAYTRVGRIVEAIRALKPAPRSAEHTAEPSAQSERQELAGEIRARWEREKFYKRAALATAPSTRIEAEPVCEVRDYWLGNVLTTWHSIGLPPIGTKLYLAPPDRTPDARSTSDAAVGGDYAEVVRVNRIIAAPQDVVHRWETPLWKDAPHTGEFIHRLRDALTDRATRSTDSSAEAVNGNALRDEFEQWYVENAFDFKRNPIGSGLCGQQWFAYAGAKGLSKFEANRVLLDRMARAEAAKLTTAPHTAEEMRVDGGAT